MPGRTGGQTRADQEADVGVAGQQAGDQGPVVVAGARVDDQPGGLVDHRELVVVVHHVKRTEGSGAARWGRPTPARRPSVAPASSAGCAW